MSDEWKFIREDTQYIRQRVDQLHQSHTEIKATQATNTTRIGHLEQKAERGFKVFMVLVVGTIAKWLHSIWP